MQSIILNLWDKYVQFYLDHYSSPDINREEGLPYLRDKLFVTILLLAFPLCILTYIPSVIVAVKVDQFIVALSDSVGMLILTFIFFSRNTSIRVRKNIFSTVFYLLSVILIVYLGAEGPGFIILICLSVMITLFEGKKNGFIAVLINAIIYFSLLIILPVESLNLKLFSVYNLAAGIGVGLNLVVFNTLAVLSAGSLVNHLNQSFLKEKELQSLLKKESQELLKSKIKAEESDRLKTSFLANLSHEIRTPMNGILGFSYLLGESGLSKEDRDEYISLIHKSGDRLLNVINQIVDISKIESGLIDVKFLEVNLNDQVESVYNLFKSNAEDKKLKLSYKTGLPQGEAVIKTDKEKLNEILTSLVDNSIKYTDAGSIEFGYSLVIRKSFDESDYQQEPEDETQELLFFVTDTGIGIPADRLVAVFDRFIKADIYDREAREGVGLGLSIAKSYVEMLGGRIWAESEYGKGSSFYFTIPCSIETNQKLAREIFVTERESGSNNLNLNILIAEDDEISSILLEQIIRKISKRTIIAKNGIEAVEKFRNNPDIDLILMDIRMPGMDGLEATKQIRQFNENVTVIAQTAFVMAGERTLALEAGCNDFISKPINEDELLAMIQLNCGNKQQNNMH